MTTSNHSMTHWWLLLAIAALFAFFGCDRPTPKTDAALRAAVDRIRYVREPRSGVCFAMLGSTTTDGDVVTSIAVVPCDAVARELVR